MVQSVASHMGCLRVVTRGAPSTHMGYSECSHRVLRTHTGYSVPIWRTDPSAMRPRAAPAAKVDRRSLGAEVSVCTVFGTVGLRLWNLRRIASHRR
jgi:hypothetical protein